MLSETKYQGVGDIFISLVVLFVSLYALKDIGWAGFFSASFACVFFFLLLLVGLIRADFFGKSLLTCCAELMGQGSVIAFCVLAMVAASRMYGAASVLCSFLCILFFLSAVVAAYKKSRTIAVVLLSFFGAAVFFASKIVEIHGVQVFFFVVVFAPVIFIFYGLNFSLGVAELFFNGSRSEIFGNRKL